MARGLALGAASLAVVAAAAACDRIAGVRDLTLAGLTDASGIEDAPIPPTDSSADAGADTEPLDAAPWTEIDLDASPVRIAVDDTHLYWSTLPRSADGGEIRRMPKNGGPAELVAAKVPQANGLALDTDFLYVTTGQNFGDGTIVRLAKDGGASFTLAKTLSAPLGIATDDASVYWVDLGDGGSITITGRVVRAGKDGSGQKDLASGLVIPVAVAVDSTAVFYTTSGLSSCDGGGVPTGTIERVAPDGGAHVTLAQDQDCPAPIALHDTRVFWANQSLGAGTINVVDKSGGPVTVLAKNQPLPGGVVSDGTRVYWINSTVPDGTMVSCVIASCSTTLAPVGQNELGPISIDIDTSSVFWAELGVPPAQPGSLHRTPFLGKP